MSGILANAVAAAIKSISSSLPELARTMEADGATGTVVVASSVDKAIDPASTSGAAEAFRVVAKVADFPILATESLVSLDTKPHLITSLRATGGASWTVGLSPEMDSTECAVSGTRRGNGGVRAIEFTIPALVTEAEPGTPSDAYAVRYASATYYVIIREGDWPETIKPDTGDALRFWQRGTEIVANVAKATHRAGQYILTARER